MSLGSFGNPITGADGDLTVNQIQSPNFNLATKTGWQIQKNGNAFFFNITATGTITATVFDGTDFTIDSAGYFLYSGTPGAGDLIGSIAGTAGTDPFTNPYQAGFTSYGTGGAYAQLVDGALNFQGASGQATPASLFTADIAGAIALNSGLVTGGDIPADITLTSEQANAGVAEVNVSCDTVLFNATTFNIQPASGPFIAGEGFHPVSLSGGPAGITGSIRVKKLPWNGVWLDAEISFTTLVANSTTSIGTLPAGYYPTVARQFALGVSGTVTNANTPRIFVPTSGALQLILPIGANGAGCSVMYPTN